MDCTTATPASSGSPIYSLDGKRILLLGGSGMVGAALQRRLGAFAGLSAPPSSQYDLREPADASICVAVYQPHVVIIAAGTVGGILANQSRPADFLSDNLLIAANCIGAAQRHGVEKLLYLGTSCAYPRDAAQPITESSLLTGPLEPTNEPYAIAKIAGVKLCEAYRRQHGCDFIAAMPTNLYGPGDTYDAVKSHVVPALIDKMHRAKLIRAEEVVIWGSGKPRREFLHVDDLADAAVCLLERYSAAEPINVGAGIDVTVKELAWAIAETVGYEGAVRFDIQMPDGTPRKLLDSSKINALGWSPRIGLRDGLADAYRDYLARFTAAAAA